MSLLLLFANRGAAALEHDDGGAWFQTVARTAAAAALAATVTTTALSAQVAGGWNEPDAVVTAPAPVRPNEEHDSTPKVAPVWGWSVQPAPWSYEQNEWPTPAAPSVVEDDEPWTVVVPPVWGTAAPLPLWLADPGDLPPGAHDEGDRPVLATPEWWTVWRAPWFEQGESKPQIWFDEEPWTSGVAPIWAYPPPPVASDPADFPIPTPASLVGDEPWTLVRLAPVWDTPTLSVCDPGDLPPGAHDEGDQPVRPAPVAWPAVTPPWYDQAEAPPQLGVNDEPWTVVVPPVWSYPAPAIATDPAEAPIPTPASLVGDEPWTTQPAPVWSYPAPAVAQESTDLPPGAHEDGAVPVLATPEWWSGARLVGVEDDLPVAAPAFVDDDAGFRPWVPPAETVPAVSWDAGDLPIAPAAPSFEEAGPVLPAPVAWPAPVPTWADELLPVVPAFALEDGAWQPPVLAWPAVVPPAASDAGELPPGAHDEDGWLARPLAADTAPVVPAWDDGALPVPTPASLVGDEPWTTWPAPVHIWPAPAVARDDGDLPIAPPSTTRDEDFWTTRPAPVHSYPAPAVASDPADFPIPTPGVLVGGDGGQPTVAPIWSYPVPWVAQDDGAIAYAPRALDDGGAVLVPVPLEGVARLPVWHYDQPDLPLLRVDDQPWVQVVAPPAWPAPAPVLADDEIPTPKLADDDTGWMPPVLPFRLAPVPWWEAGEGAIVPPTALVAIVTEFAVRPSRVTAAWFRHRVDVAEGRVTVTAEFVDALEAEMRPNVVDLAGGPDG